MSHCKTFEEQVVAILHDILEDTETKISDLRNIGCSEDIVDAVIVITKQGFQSYQEYLERVSNNTLATAVKIQDLRHNMDLTRLKKITDKDIERNIKYAKALQYLINRTGNYGE